MLFIVFHMTAWVNAKVSYKDTCKKRAPRYQWRPPSYRFTSTPLKGRSSKSVSHAYKGEAGLTLLSTCARSPCLHVLQCTFVKFFVFGDDFHYCFIKHLLWLLSCLSNVLPIFSLWNYWLDIEKLCLIGCDERKCKWTMILVVALVLQYL